MTFAHNYRYSLSRNADLSYNTLYQNGNAPGAGPQVAVDPVAFAQLVPGSVNLNTGTAYSVNLRGALTGAQKATAVLSIVSVSGSDPAASGWSITNSDFLTCNGNTAGSGVLDVIATDSLGNPVTFPNIVWAYSTASGTDTTAPTLPTGVQGSVVSSTVKLILDAAIDNQQQNATASGIDHYNIYDGATKILPSPVTAPNKGAIGPKFTVYAIGSGDTPAPQSAVVQNGNTWTITDASIGFHNVAVEECTFIGAALAGDQSFALSVPAFTGISVDSPAGIMVREAPDQGAVFVAFYHAQTYLQVKIRSVTGGKATNSFTLTGITGAVRLQVQRAGNVFTFMYSQDGGVWKVASTQTITLAQTPLWGGTASSQAIASAMTCTLVDFNTAVGNQVAIDVPISSTANINVTSVDKSGNESGTSIVLPFTPVATGGGSGAGIRFTMGAWREMDNGGKAASIDSQASAAAANGYVGIFMIHGLSSWMTNATTLSRSTTDQIQAAAAKYNLAWGIGIEDRSFGNPGTYSSASPGQAGLPSDWSSSEFVTSPSGSTGNTISSMARNDHKYWTDRLVGFIKLFYQTYGSDPRCEMVRGPETAVDGGWIKLAGGYTDAAYFAQIQSLFPQARAVAPLLDLSMSMNYAGADSDMVSLFARMAQPDCRCGSLGPDQLTSRNFISNRCMNGYATNGILYRNMLPVIAEFQYATINQSPDTAASIVNFLMNGDTSKGGSVKPHKYLISPFDGPTLKSSDFDKMVKAGTLAFNNVRPSLLT